MTTIDLDKLEALCDGATPGPWAHDQSKRLVNGESVPLISAPDGGDFRTHVADCQFYGAHSESQCWANARFIAEARTALPALITELRAARNYIALLEQAAGTMIQVERERRAVVFERSTVFSRPECVFKYCASPSDCQERCMLTKRGSEPSP